jgi:transposase-like protein
MERCNICGKEAAYICPYCDKKFCKQHMELRYVGQDRGFKSRYMCPSCWKKKQVVLNEKMISTKNYKPKKYFY